MSIKIMMIALFILMKCSFNEEIETNGKTIKNNTEIINNDSMVDKKGFLFSPFEFPTIDFLFDLDSINYFNRSLLDSSTHLMYSKYIDNYSFGITMLNKYLEPTGKTTYIPSEFWDENDDNAGFSRPIPEKVDFLIEINRDLPIKYLKILDIDFNVQLVAGLSFDCKYVTNPILSAKSVLLTNLQVIFNNDLETKFILIKNYPIKKELAKLVNNNEGYSLNQVRAEIIIKHENNLIGKVEYFHPVCSSFDDGEEIIKLLEEYDKQ